MSKPVYYVVQQVIQVRLYHLFELGVLLIDIELACNSLDDIDIQIADGDNVSFFNCLKRTNK